MDNKAWQTQHDSLQAGGAQNCENETERDNDNPERETYRRKNKAVGVGIFRTKGLMQ